MLENIHNSLKKLLYEHGKISRSEVDVQFELPGQKWLSSLNRPTINLYLFDMEENLSLRNTAFDTSKQDGMGLRRAPPKRINLHYHVIAVSSDIRDQHELLWRVTATLMRHSELPGAVLSPDLAALELPVLCRMGNSDDPTKSKDLWAGLDLPPQPSLHYVLTAPLDLERLLSTPLVLTRSIQYRESASGAQESPYRAYHIGGVVRDSDGTRLEGVSVWLEGSTRPGVLSDEQGQFVLPSVPAGEIHLRVARAGEAPRQVRLQVPAEQYEIVLE